VRWPPLVKYPCCDAGGVPLKPELRTAGRQAGWLAGWQAGWLAGWQAGRQHKARAASAGVGPPAKLWKLMAVVCAVI
jgi:hypothetical protein